MARETYDEDGCLIITYETEYVYALVDPRSDKVRYIGRSRYPEQRLAQHMHPPAKSVVRSWILELRAANLQPHMLILETSNEGEAWQVEADMIAKYRKELGEVLLNRNGTYKPDREMLITYADGTPFSG